MARPAGSFLEVGSLPGCFDLDARRLLLCGCRSQESVHVAMHSGATCAAEGVNPKSLRQKDCVRTANIWRVARA